MKKTILAVLAALSLAPRAGAMEISLEENRGQRGSIGYVDLQAVFRRFPEVQRAKQSYAEIVRQAEEQVNLKKSELIRLRADISSLKAERDAAARAPLVAPAPAPAPQEAPGPQAAPPAAPAPAAPDPAPAPKEAASPVSTLPGMAAAEPLRIAIPGLPEETLAPADGAAAPAAPTAPAAAAPAAPAAPAPPPAPSAAELQAAAEEQLRRRDAKVKELDAAVAAKEAELEAKQAGLASYQAQVEKDLVDIESRRSELLLGRIYAAVKETAVENGVSVVIDKTAILFGQGSVDLTDKVLKRLEGTLP